MHAALNTHAHTYSLAECAMRSYVRDGVVCEIRSANTTTQLHMQNTFIRRATMTTTTGIVRGDERAIQMQNENYVWRVCFAMWNDENIHTHTHRRADSSIHEYESGANEMGARRWHDKYIRPNFFGNVWFFIVFLFFSFSSIRHRCRRLCQRSAQVFEATMSICVDVSVCVVIMTFYLVCGRCSVSLLRSLGCIWARSHTRIHGTYERDVRSTRCYLANHAHTLPHLLTHTWARGYLSNRNSIQLEMSSGEMRASNHKRHLAKSRANVESIEFDVVHIFQRAIYCIIIVLVVEQGLFESSHAAFALFWKRKGFN